MKSKIDLETIWVGSINQYKSFLTRTRKFIMDRKQIEIKTQTEINKLTEKHNLSYLEQYILFYQNPTSGKVESKEFQHFVNKSLEIKIIKNILKILNHNNTIQEKIDKLREITFNKNLTNTALRLYNGAIETLKYIKYLEFHPENKTKKEMFIQSMKKELDKVHSEYSFLLNKKCEHHNDSKKAHYYKKKIEAINFALKRIQKENIYALKNTLQNNISHKIENGFEWYWDGYRDGLVLSLKIAKEIILSKDNILLSKENIL